MYTSYLRGEYEYDMRLHVELSTSAANGYVWYQISVLGYPEGRTA